MMTILQPRTERGPWEQEAVERDEAMNQALEEIEEVIKQDMRNRVAS